MRGRSKKSPPVIRGWPTEPDHTVGKLVVRGSRMTTVVICPQFCFLFAYLVRIEETLFGHLLGQGQVFISFGSFLFNITLCLFLV